MCPRGKQVSTTQRHKIEASKRPRAINLARKAFIGAAVRSDALVRSFFPSKFARSERTRSAQTEAVRADGGGAADVGGAADAATWSTTATWNRYSQHDGACPPPRRAELDLPSPRPASMRLDDLQVPAPRSDPTP